MNLNTFLLILLVIAAYTNLYLTLKKEDRTYYLHAGKLRLSYPESITSEEILF